MLPDGWVKVPLSQVAEVRTGLAVGRSDLQDPVELPYLRVANVQDGRLDLSEIKLISIERSQIERYQLQAGDVLMTEGGDFDKLGRGDVWRGQLPICLHQNHVFCVRPNRKRLHPDFLAALSASDYGKSYFLSCAKRSTNLASINSTQLKEFPVLLPSLSEQRRIANLLSHWDRAISVIQRIIDLSKVRRRALAKQLLTGAARFPNWVRSKDSVLSRYGTIPRDWRFVRLGEVAIEINERHESDQKVPVLSCSKHDGFVSSLSYFKKKVYSDDLSNYKLVRRGDFGFPSNHIEEGSIGLQDIVDCGIVSPIYVVFRTVEDVYARYLYQLLKTDHYRQIFAATTSASVDRRGSLRWKEFKNIRIALPVLEEQKAISTTIDTAQREVSAWQLQLRKLRDEKAALSQQLLMGKRRVKPDPAAAA